MVFNFEFSEIVEINKFLRETRNSTNLSTDSGKEKVIKVNRLLEITTREIKRISSELPRTYDNQTGNYYPDASR